MRSGAPARRAVRSGAPARRAVRGLRAVGHELARALRRSSMRCDGINVFLCDGEAAFQTVFHFHLHVIPRFEGDGWTILPDEVERERSLLDGEAQAIRDAIASSA